MTSRTPADGYEVQADGLTGQVRALVDIGDQTRGLVSSAGRLAEREPLLGTAPPAMHLAMRLREAAGPTGLTGEVSAADTELSNYHQALQATLAQYQESDSAVARRLNDEGRAT